MLILLLLGVLVTYVLVTWVNALREKRKSKLDGPALLPVVGYGHRLIGLDSAGLIRVFGEFAEAYNDAAFAQILDERYVVLSHPKYVEHIISSTEIITKGRSYNFLHPWLGQGLLTATGYRWKSHRKFLTPAFHFNILASFLPVFIKTSRVLTEKLQQRADGTPFDLFPIIALAALDNVTESIMGVSFNALKDSESKYVKAIETLSEIVSLRMRHVLLGNDFFFSLSPYKKTQNEALEILHGHTRKVIETRRNQLENEKVKIENNEDIGLKNKYAFLDLLLLAEVDGKPISDESVREEVDTFMFEGHDTTASGIVFSLYCLAKHEEVQKKVLEEQKSIFGDDLTREPTYADLQQMKYLECVIKEALRLYPSVPFIQRRLTQDVDVMDFHLSKGTSVILNIFHLQRNPAVFEDPLLFNPERFFETAKPGNAYNWIPFSAGPRNCIGQKFAMMEMKVTLAAIVRQFRLAPGPDPDLCGALILKATQGVSIRMKPRV